ncbi:hypothetical protein ACOSP7_024349 [Xanthoceras sorbifolium]
MEKLDSNGWLQWLAYGSSAASEEPTPSASTLRLSSPLKATTNPPSTPSPSSKTSVATPAFSRASSTPSSRSIAAAMVAVSAVSVDRGWSC